MSTCCRYDDSSTKTAFDTFLEFADNSSSNQSQAAHSSLTAPVHPVLSESGEPSGEPQEEATNMQGHEDVHGRLRKQLSEVFAELIKCDDELAKYVQMANEERVIVETTKVLDLFNGKCQVEKCSGERKVIRHSVDGGCSQFPTDVQWDMQVFGTPPQFSLRRGTKRCLLHQYCCHQQFF